MTHENAGSVQGVGRKWDDGLDPRTIPLAEFLHSLGWRSPNDAQLQHLNGALADIAALATDSHAPTDREVEVLLEEVYDALQGEGEWALLPLPYQIAMARTVSRVTGEYDGVHRLRLAVAAWSKATADEGGRGALLRDPANPKEKP